MYECVFVPTYLPCRHTLTHPSLGKSIEAWVGYLEAPLVPNKGVTLKVLSWVWVAATVLEPPMLIWPTGESPCDIRGGGKSSPLKPKS